MKMKIVVRVSLDDHKSRSKALQISVSVCGVESASLKGDALEVIGEGVDPVELTRQLRKKMSRADLVSVGEAKPPAPAPAATKPVTQEVVNWVTCTPYPYNCNTYPVCVYDHGPGCAIL